uniref:Uncharacterized protein n=1 Tax=Setaria italica TaxID=4555 RepID=K3YKS8_SETIT
MLSHRVVELISASRMWLWMMPLPTIPLLSFSPLLLNDQHSRMEPMRL